MRGSEGSRKLIPAFHGKIYARSMELGLHRIRRGTTRGQGNKSPQPRTDLSTEGHSGITERFEISNKSEKGDAGD